MHTAPRAYNSFRSDRDALIAARALVHGLTVVTNVADCERMGVGVLNPWEVQSVLDRKSVLKRGKSVHENTEPSRLGALTWHEPARLMLTNAVALLRPMARLHLRPYAAPGAVGFQLRAAARSFQ